MHQNIWKYATSLSLKNSVTVPVRSKKSISYSYTCIYVYIYSPGPCLTKAITMRELLLHSNRIEKK